MKTSVATCRRNLPYTKLISVSICSLKLSWIFIEFSNFEGNLWYLNNFHHAEGDERIIRRKIKRPMGNWVSKQSGLWEEEQLYISHIHRNGKSGSHTKIWNTYNLVFLLAQPTILVLIFSGNRIFVPTSGVRICLRLCVCNFVVVTGWSGARGHIAFWLTFSLKVTLWLINAKLYIRNKLVLSYFKTHTFNDPLEERRKCYFICHLFSVILFLSKNLRKLWKQFIPN